ncbi:MAG: O-antigen ligase family protein [candidate division WOR-3 bacterium]|nr:O-antigen ligase family protein [candidate division WOR-3 bacterium]MDW8150660.1 O-antigen ligase family protein [candidate division WOR-3 bacterium]
MLLSISNLLKISYFLTFFFGFIGQAISIKLGIAIFPFRVFFVITIILLILKFLIEQGSFYNFIRNSIKYGWFLVILFIWSYVSLMWVVDFKYVPNELFNLSVYIIFSLISLSIIEDKKDLFILVKIWIFVFFLSILVAFWEIMTAQHLITSQYHRENYVHNKYETFIVLSKVYIPTSFYGNQNDFSTYIILSIPIIFFLLRNYLISIPLIFTGIFIIVYVMSRANLIGLFFQSIILPFFMSKRFNLIYVPLLILTIFSSIYAIWYLANTSYPSFIKDDRLLRFYANIRNKVIQTAKAGRDFSTIIRENLYKSSVEYFLESKGLGVGVGQLRYLLEESPKYYVFYFRDPHNFYLEILTKFGIFVFIAYILYLIYIIVNCLVSIKNPFSRAILLSIVGFLFGSISPYSLVLFYPFWAFLVLVMNYFKVELK